MFRDEYLSYSSADEDERCNLSTLSNRPPANHGRKTQQILILYLTRVSPHSLNEARNCVRELRTRSHLNSNGIIENLMFKRSSVKTSHHKRVRKIQGITIGNDNAGHGQPKRLS